MPTPHPCPCNLVLHVVPAPGWRQVHCGWPPYQGWPDCRLANNLDHALDDNPFQSETGSGEPQPQPMMGRNTQGHVSMTH